MIPLSVFFVKGIGIVIAMTFLKTGLKEIQCVERHHIAHSTTGRPSILLLYRVSMFIVTLAVLYAQVTTRSLRAFRYFTVWNWVAIIVYFFLASVSSIRWVYAPEKRTKEGSQSSLIDQIVASMFHTIVPMTLFIDIITWTILVPALMNHPDPERAAHWQHVMFSTISYMQHGGNAFIMFGEMMLNTIPNSNIWSHGVVSLWNILFGLWSFYFFWSTGEALYPFLDYTRHDVYLSFSSLFVCGIGSSFAVQKVLKHKHAFVMGSPLSSRTRTYRHA